MTVDTHVWQIAERKLKALKSQKLNAKTYDVVGDYFRSKYGEYAGWAHCFEFAAELKDFQIPNQLAENKKKADDDDDDDDHKVEVKKDEDFQLETKKSNKKSPPKKRKLN